jgi:hypothetical protein
LVVEYRRLEMEQKPFSEVKGKVEVRSGSRAPWIELQVTREDGKVLKYVMKKVDSFYSERQGTVVELE